MTDEVLHMLAKNPVVVTWLRTHLQDSWGFDTNDNEHMD